MEISLYTNTSSRNTVDKSLTLFKTYTTSYMKFPTDILNPTIRITDQLEDGILDCNYAYIKDFGRYYFIENITIFNNETIDIYLNVDVLMSYYSNILALRCPIARNEFTYVENIVDDKCAFTHNVKIEYLGITNLIFPSDSVQLSRSPDYNIKLTWLTDITGVGLVGPNLELPQTCNDIGEFKRELVPNEVASTSVLLTQDQAKTFLAQVFNSTTAISYIKSLVALPIKFTPNVDIDITTGQSIRINGQNYSIGSAIYKSRYNVIKVQMARFLFDNCIAQATNPNQFDWQKKSPYTKYELYVPYHGFVELNYEQCVGQTLDVVVFVHLESDKQTLAIYRESDGKVIFESDIDIGYKLGVSATNAYENNRLKEAYTTGYILKAIGSLAMIGVGAGAAAISGGVTFATAATMVAGGSSLLSSTGNFVEQFGALFDRADKVGISTAENGLANSFNCYMKIQYARPDLEYASTNWKHLNGLPLYNTLTLNTLKGFTVIEDAKIEFGLSQEQKLIKDFFRNGIYLPEVRSNETKVLLVGENTRTEL